jgi:hypothetical protein
VDGEAKPEHFEGITLLPASRATNVVNVTLMIGITQNAGTVVYGFKTEEEMLSTSEVGYVIANQHVSVVVGVRRFTSERIESRVPTCLIKRIA